MESNDNAFEYTLLKLIFILVEVLDLDLLSHQ